MNKAVDLTTAIWVQPGLRRFVVDEAIKSGSAPDSPVVGMLVMLDQHLCSVDSDCVYDCTTESLAACITDPLNREQDDDERVPTYGWLSHDTPESKGRIMASVNNGMGAVFSTKGVVFRVTDTCDPKLYFVELNKREDDHVVKMSLKQTVTRGSVDNLHLSQEVRQRVILFGRHFLCCAESRGDSSSKSICERVRGINLLSEENRLVHTIDCNMLKQLMESLRNAGSVRFSNGDEEPPAKRQRHEPSDLDDVSTELLLKAFQARVRRGEVTLDSLRGVLNSNRKRLVKEKKLTQTPWLEPLCRMVMQHLEEEEDRGMPMDLCKLLNGESFDDEAASKAAPDQMQAVIDESAEGLAKLNAIAWTLRAIGLF